LIPAFKAILFRTVPGEVPRVKTCAIHSRRLKWPAPRGTSLRPHVIQELSRARMNSDSASPSVRIGLAVFGLPSANFITWGEQKANLLESRSHGPASPRARGSTQPEGFGRSPESALNDEHHGRAGLLSVRPFSLPDWSWTFPNSTCDSGACPGVEAYAEVAVALQTY
jgi:hypothetical protein